MRAVYFILLTSLDADGPGDSALKICMAFPSDGRTASTNTKTPIPPIQWVKRRQNIIALESPMLSLGKVKIDAPVVVNPETVSKNASKKYGISPLIIKGKQPTSEMNIQHSATMTNPSLA